MVILKYFVIAVIFIFLISILILAVRSKNAFKYLALNSLLGILVFLLLYFTKKFTGLFLPLNPVTAVISTLFGIPGIIGLLILNFIV